MVKVKIRTGRGTGTKEVDAAGKDWAGDEYRKKQAEAKKKAGNVSVGTGRPREPVAESSRTYRTP